MAIEDLSRVLREHPFLKGLPERFLPLVTGCAANRRFEEGARLIEEGQEASTVHLVRSGGVALETAIPDDASLLRLLTRPRLRPARRAALASSLLAGLAAGCSGSAAVDAGAPPADLGARL